MKISELQALRVGQRISHCELGEYRVYSLPINGHVTLERVRPMPLVGNGTPKAQGAYLEQVTALTCSEWTAETPEQYDRHTEELLAAFCDKKGA